jgi:hypothetical protein
MLQKFPQFKFLGKIFAAVGGFPHGKQAAAENPIQFAPGSMKAFEEVCFRRIVSRSECRKWSNFPQQNSTSP